jgi:putative membrane protein
MIAQILAALVAAIHAYILVLEMFLWDTPRGRKAFGTTADFAAQTRVLAANQGLYNGFLAAGLIYGLVRGGDEGFAFLVFFLVRQRRAARSCSSRRYRRLWRWRRCSPGSEARVGS